MVLKSQASLLLAYSVGSKLQSRIGLAGASSTMGVPFPLRFWPDPKKVDVT
jgi:hypothetical protein